MTFNADECLEQSSNVVFGQKVTYNGIELNGRSQIKHAITCSLSKHCICCALFAMSYTFVAFITQPKP